MLAFLRDLAAALTGFTAELERHAAVADGRHPRLALDHGLAVYRASLGWTRQAIAALSAAPPAGGSGQDVAGGQGH